MIARRVYSITGLVLLTALVFVLVAGCLLLNSSPVASFTFHLSQRDPPCVVTLDASASHDPDGIIVKYDWDFGDGSGGSGESISHTYATSGTFTIDLKATDNDGKTTSVSERITVLPPYVPTPDPSPPTPPSSGPLRFSGRGSPVTPPSLVLQWGGTFYVEGACVVSLFDDQHKWVALLADENGSAFTRKTVIVDAGIFYLDIAADGDWAITVFTATDGPVPPQTYAGHGQRLFQYSSLFSVNSGRLTTFYLEGVKRVVLLSHEAIDPDPGMRVRVLVNTKWGSYAGHVTVNDIPGGVYVLRVQASGDWSISVE